jgi:hypothetical protein
LRVTMRSECFRSARLGSVLSVYRMERIRQTSRFRLFPRRVAQPKTTTVYVLAAHQPEEKVRAKRWSGTGCVRRIKISCSEHDASANNSAIPARANEKTHWIKL